LDLRQLPKPRPWVSAQDGHSNGEQKVYQIMFNHGKPVNANTRCLVIGVLRLSKLVPMAYGNCLANLRSLIKKLAIDAQPAARHQDGQRFLIYSYEEILRRRRKAGLTHVLKRTSKVILLNPGTPELGTAELSSSTPSLGTAELSSGTPSLCSSGTPSLGVPFIIVFKEEVSRKGTSSSSSTSLLVPQVFLEVVGFSDDDAVRRLMEGCRANAPDATEEEVAHFLRIQAARFSRNPRVQNLVGLLISQVPKCFEGESFHLYREAVKKRQEAERQEKLAMQAEWRKILEDPQSSEEERQFARQVLEQE
jgi:hypothetical protein